MVREREGEGELWILLNLTKPEDAKIAGSIARHKE
jgi:hypothetical protein